MKLQTIYSMELETKGKLLLDEPLSSYTSLRLGGKARYFLLAANRDDIKRAIYFAKESGIPSFIMGKGSNLLFGDEGFTGVVISTVNMKRVDVFDNQVIAEAGASLSDVINIAKESSLAGFESLYGIPGTVGGAAVMNAGAFGCEIGDYVKAAEVLRSGEEVRIEDIRFAYRESSLSKEIILSLEFSLQEKKKEEIEKKIREVVKKRTERQPVFSSSIGTCGSVFKNPPGSSAGELIEKSGIKGMKVGGVEVSSKHCNYFLTHPNATSEDFIDLVRFVRDKVKKDTGVILELEVKIIGKEKEIQI
jgi:UDP-N-acetylmuramate dehydrogenase